MNAESLPPEAFLEGYSLGIRRVPTGSAPS